MARSFHHPNFKGGLLDKVAFFAAFLQPLMTLPQLHQIYTTKDVGSLSTPTWLAYTVLGTVVLVYAIKKPARALILGQATWVIADFGVLLGILLYR